MKKCGVVFFLFFLFFTLCTNAQVITTFAGGGSTSGDGGSATAAYIQDPAGIAFNKYGVCYIVSCLSGNKIRKIDTSGIITTFAGTGMAGYSGDGGQATACKLNTPIDIALDSLGNLYISENANSTIRKINVSTGIISTICGNGSIGSTGDGGAATAALLNDPNGICFDKYGNLYIADFENNKVRKINASGIISTFAGTGVYGFSGDGGAASAAQLWVPGSVTSDDTGNIYIGDKGNFRIRKVDTSGIISTFAGNGSDAYSGDGIPAINAQFGIDWIRMDTANNLYIGDNINYRVFKVDNSGVIHDIAGDGMASFSGDGGMATAASIYYPSGIAFDRCGNLYIGDVNVNRIRKVTYDSTCNPYTSEPLYAPITPVNTSIFIYPNPATVALNVLGLNKINQITISNFIGQTLYSGVYDINKAEVNITDLPPGVYMIRITDGDGKLSINKFVKE